MKILMLSRATLYSSPGGDTVQVLETANHLRKKGVVVDVKLTNEDVIYANYDLIHFFNIIRPADILRHILKTTVPFAVSTIFVDYGEYEKKNRKGLLGFLNNIMPSDTIEYFKCIARFILNGEQIGGTNYLLWGHRKSIRYILSKASVILPNSNSEYLRLHRKYNETPTYMVVPNAISTSNFVEDRFLIRKRDAVLCVGRVEGRKNQFNLIKAMNRLGYPTYIIGNHSPNSYKYYMQCKEIANSNIQFIPHLSQDKLVEYYQKAKVHVLPSWFETTGLSSLEAAAMGCNIVVSPKGDTKEYFKDYASYCDPEDVDSITEAIKEQYDKETAAEFKDYILKNYTWDKAADKTLEAYKKVLQK